MAAGVCTGSRVVAGVRTGSRVVAGVRTGGRVAAGVRTVIVGAALAVLVPTAAAAPDEVDPDLAARDEDYAAGQRALAARNWAEATRRLSSAEKRHPEHPDLHNALGFAHRQQRQYDLAFKHYRRALELDPRHRGAHEYIGEAYLLTGDLAGAERHRAALKQICLLPCEELVDLERAIAAHRGKP